MLQGTEQSDIDEDRDEGLVRVVMVEGRLLLLQLQLR